MKQSIYLVKIPFSYNIYFSHNGFSLESPKTARLSSTRKKWILVPVHYRKTAKSLEETVLYTTLKASRRSSPLKNVGSPVNMASFSRSAVRTPEIDLASRSLYST